MDEWYYIHRGIHVSCGSRVPQPTAKLTFVLHDTTTTPMHLSLAPSFIPTDCTILQVIHCTYRMHCFVLTAPPTQPLHLPTQRPNIHPRRLFGSYNRPPTRPPHLLRRPFLRDSLYRGYQRHGQRRRCRRVLLPESILVHRRLREPGCGSEGCAADSVHPCC